MKALFATFGVVSMFGCVYDPLDRTQVESTDPIRMVGGAARDRSIEIRAVNQQTRSSDTVGITRSASTPDAVGLFGWTAPPSLLPEHWSPQSRFDLMHSVGRVELSARVEGTTAPFRTFTAADMECVAREESGGATPAAARARCVGGTSLTMFDNSGVGVGEAGPAGLAWVRDTPVFHEDAVPGGFGVNWEIGHYRMLAAVEPGGIDVHGIICRPDKASGLSGPLRTVIINHGGFGGIEPVIKEACLTAARAGWLAAASGYRYEGVCLGTWTEGGKCVGSSPIVVPRQLDKVELCLGEVTDVLRFTDIVLARPDADRSRVLMWGHSHGGCVTLRAVQQGAPVTAAAAFAAPIDFAGWHQYCAELPLSPIADCSDVDEAIATTLGGPPGLIPEAYRWRSPLTFARDLTARPDVKLLVLTGDTDRLIYPRHTCELASATYGRARYFSSGTRRPADCAGISGITWTTSAATPPIEDHQLIVFQGANHETILGPVPFGHFLRFVETFVPRTP